MTVRAAVRDAVGAAAIPGVSGHQYPPTVKGAGTVWAQWVSTAVQQAFCGPPAWDETVWSVLCVLPADTPASTAMAEDAWLPRLLDALGPIGQLGACEPVDLTVSPGSAVPALRIELTTRGGPG